MSTKILVSLEDFTLRPCGRYDQFFQENEVDLFEVIETVNKVNLEQDLAWAINNSPKLQRTKLLQIIFKRYLETNPSASKILRFMVRCNLVRTPKMKKAFWTANPDAETIQHILSEKLIVPTKKVEKLFLEKKREYVKNFLKRKPRLYEIYDKLTRFTITHIPEMLEGFLALNPNADEIYSLLCDFEFARTYKVITAFINLTSNKKFIK